MLTSIRAVLGIVLLSSACSGNGSGGASAEASGLGGICTECDGCKADDTVVCSGGATGVSCPSQSSYPTPVGGAFSNRSVQEDGSVGLCYVAIAFPAGADCAVDYVIPGCFFPSYGLQCASGTPAPPMGDGGLTCGSVIADANGNDDYCCTHP
jgi:hypothetical protein